MPRHGVRCAMAYGAHIDNALRRNGENGMNINELTIGEIRTIIDTFGAISKAYAPGSAPAATAFSPHVGKKCIIRTYASGVFFGVAVAQDGRMIEVRDCRRLWSWKAAEGISLSAVAVNGVDPRKCRFPVATPEHTLLDALEIIPASDACIRSVEATPVASAE